MISCTFENGGKVSLRHITLGAIIIKDNKILLCKRGTFNGKPILESGNRINDSPNRPKEDRQNVDFIYTASAVKQNPVKTEEVKELRWFDLANLPDEPDWAFDHLDSVQLYLKNHQ